MTQDERALWLAERSKILGVGGSEAAAACGLLGPAARLELWGRKLGRIPEWEGNEAASWGLALESVIDYEYAIRANATTHQPDPLLMRHPERPWQFASLDRVAFPDDSEPCRNVQIKVSSTREGWGEPGTEQIPERYYCQVQHEMEVSGLRVTDVPVLFSGTKLDIYTVAYHPEFAARMTALERQFVDMLETKTEPPNDWSNAGEMIRLVQLLNRPDPSLQCYLSTDADLDLAHQWIGADEARANAAKVLKLAEERRDAVMGQLIARMGTASVGRLPNGATIERSTTHIRETKIREYDRHSFKIQGM